MLEPGASVWLDCKILHRKLLAPRPPDYGFGDLDALLIRECDGERDGFPWSHRQIPRESPAGTGEIPDCAVPVEGTSVVRDSALHGEATVGPNREGHGGLAGRRIVGGMLKGAQGPCETHDGIPALNPPLTPA